MVINNLYFVVTLVIFITQSNHIFKPADSIIKISSIDYLCLQVIYLNFQCFVLINPRLMNNYCRFY